MKDITIKKHDLSAYQGIKPREDAKKLKDFLKKRNGIEENKILSIWNKDQQKDIEIGIDGLEHGIIKMDKTNLVVSLYVDEYLKNAIKINETKPDNNHSWSVDIMLEYGKTFDDNSIPVYFVVKNNERNKGETVDFGSLHSVKVQTEKQAGPLQ